MNTYVKDPQAVLDYQLDWSEWLPEGDTIAESLWTADLDITIESEAHTDTTATVWLSGGIAYTTYKVTNQITTSQGRIDERTLYITVNDK